MVKRFLDLIAAVAGLALLLPVFAVIMIMIRKEDAGPLLYSGIRVGRNGRCFRMHKFRTMVLNADQIGGSSSADDDPRITKIGKKLRKYKLDELPQLFNVLKGEMSFVGPRPEVQHYVNMFTDQEKQILTVRPGITDWASLWNSDEGSILAGSSDPERTYMEKIRPEKIRLQLKYVQKHSLLTDFSIIIQTLLKIFKH